MAKGSSMQGKFKKGEETRYCKKEGKKSKITLRKCFIPIFKDHSKPYPGSSPSKKKGGVKKKGRESRIKRSTVKGTKPLLRCYTCTSRNREKKKKESSSDAEWQKKAMQSEEG